MHLSLFLSLSLSLSLTLTLSLSFSSFLLSLFLFGGEAGCFEGEASPPPPPLDETLVTNGYYRVSLENYGYLGYRWLPMVI